MGRSENDRPPRFEMKFEGGVKEADMADTCESLRERIRELERALVRAEAALGNAAADAARVAEKLKTAAYEANRTSDPRQAGA